MKLSLSRFVAVLAMCGSLGVSSNAFAWLKVCNGSSSATIILNFLFFDPVDCSSADGSYSGEGWFTFAPGTCGYVNGFGQSGKHVYYHANTTDNQWVWTSNKYRYWMPYAAHDHYCVNWGDNGTSGLWLNHREVYITSDNFTLTFTAPSGSCPKCPQDPNGDQCSCPLQ